MAQIRRLIYQESGGFAGLRRGCTVDAAALPPAPSQQLGALLAQPTAWQNQTIVNRMPDQLLYTLELVTEASDAASAATRGPEPKKTVHKKPVGSAPANKTSTLATPVSATTATAPTNWVLRYSATEVPESLSILMDYLHEQAKPL